MANGDRSSRHQMMPSDQPLGSPENPFRPRSVQEFQELATAYPNAYISKPVGVKDQDLHDAGFRQYEPNLGWFDKGSRAATTGALGMGTSMVSALASLSMEAMQKDASGADEMTDSWRLAQRRWANLSPDQAESMPANVGNAIGSIGGFAAFGVPAGIATAKIGIPALLGTVVTGGAIGGMATAGEQRYDARMSGATPEEVIEATRKGILPGAPEGLPIAFMAAPLLRTVPGGGALAQLVMKGFKSTTKSQKLMGAAKTTARIGFGALAETSEEIFQNIAQNYIAQNVYDPERDLIDTDELVHVAEGSFGASIIWGTIFESIFRARGGNKRLLRNMTPRAREDRLKEFQAQLNDKLASGEINEAQYAELMSAGAATIAGLEEETATAKKREPAGKQDVEPVLDGDQEPDPPYEGTIVEDIEIDEGVEPEGAGGVEGGTQEGVEPVGEGTQEGVEPVVDGTQDDGQSEPEGGAVAIGDSTQGEDTEPQATLEPKPKQPDDDGLGWIDDALADSEPKEGDTQQPADATAFNPKEMSYEDIARRVDELSRKGFDNLSEQEKAEAKALYSEQVSRLDDAFDEMLDGDKGDEPVEGGTQEGVEPVGEGTQDGEQQPSNVQPATSKPIEDMTSDEINARLDEIEEVNTKEARAEAKALYDELVRRPEEKEGTPEGQGAEPESLSDKELSTITGIISELSKLETADAAQRRRKKAGKDLLDSDTNGSPEYAKKQINALVDDLVAVHKGHIPTELLETIRDAIHSDKRFKDGKSYSVELSDMITWREMHYRSKKRKEENVKADKAKLTTIKPKSGEERELEGGAKKADKATIPIGDAEAREFRGLFERISDNKQVLDDEDSIGDESYLAFERQEVEANTERLFDVLNEIEAANKWKVSTDSIIRSIYDDEEMIQKVTEHLDEYGYSGSPKPTEAIEEEGDSEDGKADGEDVTDDDLKILETDTGDEKKDNAPKDDEPSIGEDKKKLVKEFRREIAKGRNFKTIKTLRSLAKKRLSREITENDFKAIEEAFELAIVQEANKVVEESQSYEEASDKLIEMYENQPKLSERTGNSMRLQQYSTPIPVAFFAQRMAGMLGAKGLRIFEPSAGHAALMFTGLNGKHELVAMEIDPNRAAALKSLGIETFEDDALKIDSYAGDGFTDNFDVVVANPPFGALRDINNSTIPYKVKKSGFDFTRRDYAISMNALASLDPKSGRAVLLLGGHNPRYTSETERRDFYMGSETLQFYAMIYNGYSVVDHFVLDGKLYNKQGANYPVEMVVIDQGAPNRMNEQPYQSPPPIMRTLEEVKERANEIEAKSGQRRTGLPRTDRRTADGQVLPSDVGDISTPVGSADAVPADTVSGDDSGTGTQDGGRGGQGGVGGRTKRVSAGKQRQDDNASRGRDGSADGRPGEVQDATEDAEGGGRGDTGDTVSDNPAVDEGNAIEDDNLFDEAMDEIDWNASRVVYSRSTQGVKLNPKKAADERAWGALSQLVKHRHESAERILNRGRNDLSNPRMRFEADKAKHKNILSFIASSFSDEPIGIEHSSSWYGGMPSTSWYIKFTDPLTGKRRQWRIADHELYGKPPTFHSRELEVDSQLELAEKALGLLGEKRASRRASALVKKYEAALPEFRRRAERYEQEVQDGIRLRQELGRVVAERWPKRSPSKAQIDSRLKDSGVPGHVEYAIWVIQEARKELGRGKEIDLKFSRVDTPGTPSQAEQADASPEAEYETLQNDYYQILSENFNTGLIDPNASSEQIKENYKAITKILATSMRSRMTKAEILAQAEHIKRFAREVITGRDKHGREVNFEAKFQSVSEDAVQTIYHPTSNFQAMDTRVPINLSKPTAKAMKSVLDYAREKGFNGIDEFVSDRVGMDVESLRPNVGAEQIEAVAQAIRNFEDPSRKSGHILGFQTGIGKTRSLALLIEWAKKRGMLSVVVTAKSDLYEDFVSEIDQVGGSLAKSKRIAATNDKVPKFERAKNIKTLGRQGWIKWGQSTTSRDDFNKKFRKDYDLLLTSYSQFNLEGYQRKMAEALVNENTLLIMDESHNATGTGPEVRRSKNSNKLIRSDFTIPLSKQAGAVAYSSATYLKRPDVTALYLSHTALGDAVGVKSEKIDIADHSDASEDAKKREANRLKEIIDKFKTGGLALQQTISQQLVESGYMMRLERDFSGTSFDTKSLPVNKDAYLDWQKAMITMTQLRGALIDVLEKGRSPKLRESSFMQKVEEQLSKRHNKRIKVLPPTANPKDAAGLTLAPIFSGMYNMKQQYMLAAKADAVADEVIQQIKDGRRPVITLVNTLEGFLRGFYAKDTTGRTPTFSDLAVEFLNKQRDITIKAVGSDTTYHYRLDDQDMTGLGLSTMLDTFKAAERMLLKNEVLQELPGAPIDHIRYKLKKAGIKVGEISGRNNQIDYKESKDGKTTGVLVSRTSKHKGVAARSKIINDFNNGDIQALILNESAKEGISVHSSKEFKNQEQRVMVIAQASTDINAFIQMLGRIFRTGQVHPAMYIDVVGDVPSEIGPAARRAGKMAQQNANVSGKIEGVLEANVKDYHNPIGRQVMKKVLLDHPSWRNALGVGNHNITALDREDLTRHVEGRSFKLLKEEQTFYEEFQALYEADLQIAEAQGNSPYRVKVHDWNAEDVRMVVAQEAIPSTHQSSFTQPVILKEIKTRQVIRPYTHDEIMRFLAESSGRLMYPDNKDASVEARDRVLTELGEKGDLEGFDEVSEKIREGIVGRLEKDVQKYLDRVESERNRIDGKLEESDQDKAAIEEAKQKAKENLKNIKKIFDRFRIGNAVKLASSHILNDEDNGIIIGYTYRKPNHDPGSLAGNPAGMGLWNLIVAKNGYEKRGHVTFRDLDAAIRDDWKSANIIATPLRNRKEIWDSFGKGLGVIERKENVATGNTAAAWGLYGKHGDTKIIMWSDKSGVTNTGVRLPPGTDITSSDLVAPMRFRTNENLIEYLMFMFKNFEHQESTDELHGLHMVTSQDSKLLLDMKTSIRDDKPVPVIELKVHTDIDHAVRNESMKFLSNAAQENDAVTDFRKSRIFYTATVEIRGQEERALAERLLNTIEALANKEFVLFPERAKKDALVSHISKEAAGIQEQVLKAFQAGKINENSNKGDIRKSVRLDDIKFSRIRGLPKDRPGVRKRREEPEEYERSVKLNRNDDVHYNEANLKLRTRLVQDVMKEMKRINPHAALRFVKNMATQLEGDSQKFETHGFTSAPDPLNSIVYLALDPYYHDINIMMTAYHESFHTLWRSLSEAEKKALADTWHPGMTSSLAYQNLTGQEPAFDDNEAHVTEMGREERAAVAFSYYATLRKLNEIREENIRDSFPSIIKKLLKALDQVIEAVRRFFSKNKITPEMIFDDIYTGRFARRNLTGRKGINSDVSEISRALQINEHVEVALSDIAMESTQYQSLEPLVAEFHHRNRGRLETGRADHRGMGGIINTNDVEVRLAAEKVLEAIEENADALPIEGINAISKDSTLNMLRNRTMGVMGVIETLYNRNVTNLTRLQRGAEKFEKLMKYAAGEHGSGLESAQIAQDLGKNSKIFRVQEFNRKFTQPIYKGLDEYAEKHQIEKRQAIDEFDSFLLAMHAPETNKYLKENFGKKDGSGITDTQAKGTIKKLRQDKKYTDLEKLGEIVWQMTREELELRHSSGLISDSLYETLKDRYTHWVSLRGASRKMAFNDQSDPLGEWAYEMELDNYFNAHQKGGRGSEYKLRTGRRDRPTHILVNTITQAQRAIGRAIDNETFQKLALQIEASGKLINTMKLNPMDRQKTAKPVNDFEGVVVNKGEEVEDSTGEAAEPKPKDHKYVAIATLKDVGFDPQTDAVAKFNGYPNIIRFKNDKLRKFFLGTVTNESKSAIVRGFTAFMHMIGMLHTKYNPVFWGLKNPVRDVAGSMINALEFKDKDGEVGLSTSIAKNVPKAIKLIWNKLKNPDRIAKNRLEEYTDEWMDGGGMIQYGAEILDYNPVKAREDIIKEIEKFSQSGAKSTGKRWLKAINDGLEKASQTSEAMTRLAFYISVRQRGWDLERALKESLEITTNFSSEKSMPFMDKAYIFFNARVRGTLRGGRGLKRSLSTRRLVLGMALVGMLNDWTHALFASSEDDDEETAWDRDVALWQKFAYVHFPNITGTDEKGEYNTWKLPAPHFYMWFFNVGQMIGAAARRALDPGEAFGNILADALRHTSPFDFNRAAAASIAPTAIQPAIEVWTNQDSFTGNAVYPDLPYEQGVPLAERRFRRRDPSLFGIFGSEAMGIIGADTSPYSVDQLVMEGLMGSAGRFVVDLSKFIHQVSDSEKEVDVSNIPFSRALYNHADKHRGVSNRYYELNDAAAYATDSLSKAKRERNIEEIVRLSRDFPYGIAAGRKIRSINRSLAKIGDMEHRTRIMQYILKAFWNHVDKELEENL